MAQHLYQALAPGMGAWSAGLEPGTEMSQRVREMLRYWGVEVRQHQPRAVTRELCAQADAIFVMEPDYARRIVSMFDRALADKTYLFVDPFITPQSFLSGEYVVQDPTFDSRSLSEVLSDYEWFRERIREIGAAMSGAERARLVPAARYLHLWSEFGTGRTDVR